MGVCMTEKTLRQINEELERARAKYPNGLTVLEFVFAVGKQIRDLQQSKSYDREVIQIAVLCVRFVEGE